MDIVILINLLFLFAALLLYVLLAGADFGAGILEIFIGKHPKRKEQIELMGHAIAPVWEANHVWLILAVVISFMGFPPLYEFISIYLHAPLILALIGIVARGCAFTFRHYDPYDPFSHKIYSAIFCFGSLVTPFLLGTIAGSITLGSIDPQASDFYSLYLAHWLSPFSIFLGLFLVSLCAFLAAVYLTGESQNDPELVLAFRKKAGYALVAMIITGALCFISAVFGGNFLSSFLKNPISLVSILLASILLIPLFLKLTKKPHSILVRFLGVAVVFFILLGWVGAQFPYFIKTQAGGVLIAQSAAPMATQKSLLGALLVGSCFIFPSLAYLFKIFKWDSLER